ncbi:MAG: SDR family oxidoreductase [Acidimicrobiales bacterium]|jgi:NAD(P)-dependent dehydrogenase (short-subunit alcohol dehydrogenase family)|nr:SDR family oxidoreductase [Acidimicrobiales bacterium]
MSVALVTGSSSGIGLATVVRLARAGHLVYASMRDLDRAEELREAVAAHGLDDVRLLRLDVDRDESVAQAVEQITRQSGEVDVLVNNAGISGSSAVEDTPIARFEEMLQTNFLGALRLVRAVLPTMRTRGSGHIVNVTSFAGRFCRPTMAPYAASKHALEAASEVLAQEVAAYGVRVSIIEPGTVATPMFRKGTPPPQDSAYGHWYRRVQAYYRSTLREPATAEQVAEVVHEAITTDTPRLRWVVGRDAELQLAGRAELTDEDVVALAAIPVDEDWAAAYERAYGIRPVLR